MIWNIRERERERVNIRWKHKSHREKDRNSITDYYEGWSKSKYREDQVYGCFSLPKRRTKLQFTHC